MTRAEDESKLNSLIAQLVQFKNLWDADAPLQEVLPSLYSAHRERYAGRDDPQRVPGDARLLPQPRHQGAATPMLSRRELPRTGDAAAGMPIARWLATTSTTCRWRNARAASRRRRR
jgi:arginine/lysine/ornithine decarboxylase